MKIVQMIGGLGNQMFQYAFYEALKSYHRDVEIDTSLFSCYKLHNGFELASIFGVQFKETSLLKRMQLSFHGGDIFSRILRKLIQRRNTEYIEEYLKYDEYVLYNSSNLYYIGYWQSYKYFSSIESEVRKIFTFPIALMDNYNKNLCDVILSSNSVSLHIRRGDYVGNYIYEDIATLDYYQRALDYMDRKVPNMKLFLFSNDVEWCLNNLNLRNCTVVSHNIGKNSFWDMYLMSSCKHNIIANSSFSWWGAWLNTNPDKIVVSPKRWINDNRVNIDDIIPETWICL
ncbi:alpha-1,2-fucosyltransferase [Bacteroides xylanisolvens]|uniref:alpha-1,2-fucosyltransferase n=1 Tax=Bacteroides xylanisolvens TaxID=371601 RepID=UPI00374F6B75